MKNLNIYLADLIAAHANFKIYIGMSWKNNLR